jgi:hypothetical protein
VRWVRKEWRWRGWSDGAWIFWRSWGRRCILLLCVSEGGVSREGRGEGGDERWKGELGGEGWIG